MEVRGFLIFEAFPIILWVFCKHFDFYPYTARTSRLPHAAQPHVDEFRKFIEVSEQLEYRQAFAYSP